MGLLSLVHSVKEVEVHLSELETFERIFQPCRALHASTNDLETAQFRRYLFILNE